MRSVSDEGDMLLSEVGCEVGYVKCVIPNLEV